MYDMDDDDKYYNIDNENFEMMNIKSLYKISIHFIFKITVLKLSKKTISNYFVEFVFKIIFLNKETFGMSRLRQNYYFHSEYYYHCYHYYCHSYHYNYHHSKYYHYHCYHYYYYRYN